MESLVKLTVKTPNQRIDDIQISCDLKWSVKRLKEYLQDVYPSKPESSSQRLIYLGKLLQDHDLLKEVFGEWGARTLHLVCAENNIVGDKNDMESSNNSSSERQPVVEPTIPTSSTSDDIPDGLRYRGNNHHSVPSFMPSMDSPFMAAATSMPNLAQWYLFQQQQQQPMSQQYHTQMHQYYQQMQQWQQWHHMNMNNGQWLQQQTLFGQSPPATPGSPPVLTPITPQSQQPQGAQPAQAQAGQPEPQQQQQQPNAQNQNIRMNAGVGGGAAMADDEEEENGNPRNRDWLDWLYMSMRMLMLLSIIYFYSSTSRFLMVALLGFIIYVYQAGWFTPRRRIPPPVQEPQVGQENNRNEDNNENQNTPPHDGDESSRNTEPIVIEPPRPSVFRIFCTFFVSFVTSLIPTAPPILQQQ